MEKFMKNRHKCQKRIPHGGFSGDAAQMSVSLCVSEPSIVGCRDPDQHDPTDFPHSGPTSTDQVHVQNSPTDTANNVSFPIYSPFASDL